MQLRIDKSRCNRCGLCLKACPKMIDKRDYGIFNCGCNDRKCLYSCPRQAVFEVDGIIGIDRKKCNACGDCLKVCDRKAIIEQKDYFVKCDLCFETGRQTCVEACPKKAIKLEYSEKEKGTIREVAGWRKIEHDAVKILEKGEGFEIIRTEKEPVFSVNAREIGYDEAVLLSKVMEEIRDNSEGYDEKEVGEIIENCSNGIRLEKGEKEFLAGFVRREILGYSVLDELIGKDCLEEIAVIDEKSPVYVYHKKFGWLETDIQIEDNRKLLALINKMSRAVGRRITLRKPRLNANIKLGRVHAAISPISSATSLTIRKFNKEPFTPYDLIENRTVSSEALAFLWLAVQCDFNILVCGNTGSGKTSTLNTLFSFVPKNERIIMIEETPEMNIPHRHLVKLLVNEDLKIGFDELITDTLRMRPDRIIVGEVRSANEVKALMNTMLAGQGKGSFSTFHAQNSEEALIRLKNLGISPADLCSLDLIVVQRRWTKYSGGASDVRRVVEIACLEKDSRIIRLFEYSPGKDQLEKRQLYNTGVFRKICFNFGFGRKGFEREIGRRTKLLERKPDSFEGFFSEANRLMMDDY